MYTAAQCIRLDCAGVTNYNGSCIAWQAVDKNSDDTVLQKVRVARHEPLIGKDGAAATCEKPGREPYWICDTCGKLTSDAEGTQEIPMPVEIPALGHDWGEWTETEAATCEKAGEEMRICGRDTAHTESREISAKEHHLLEHPAADATCEETGIESYWECTVCGKLFSDSKGTQSITEPVVIPAKGHTEGTPVKENEIAATCEKPGSYDTVIYCTVCGKEFSRETTEVPALGHDWDEGKATKEPTATEEGEKTYTCKICSNTRTESIPIKSERLLGDINGDGEVNATDLTILARHVAGIELIPDN